MSLLEHMTVHVNKNPDCKPGTPRRVLHVIPPDVEEDWPGMIVEDDAGCLDVAQMPYVYVCDIANGKERCRFEGCTAGQAVRVGD